MSPADPIWRVQLGFDVLNSLTLQDNVLFLEDLKVSPPFAFGASAVLELTYLFPCDCSSAAESMSSFGRETFPHR